MLSPRGRAILSGIAKRGRAIVRHAEGSAWSFVMLMLLALALTPALCAGIFGMSLGVLEALGGMDVARVAGKLGFPAAAAEAARMLEWSSAVCGAYVGLRMRRRVKAGMGIDEAFEEMVSFPDDLMARMRAEPEIKKKRAIFAKGAMGAILEMPNAHGLVWAMAGSWLLKLPSSAKRSASRAAARAKEAAEALAAEGAEAMAEAERRKLEIYLEKAKRPGKKSSL